MAPVMQVGRQGMGWVSEPLEYNPALQFPASVPIFDSMRSTDGHVGSVLEAMTLPILRARWDLTGDDVRDEVMTLCRTELGINAPGEARTRRRREGISWKNHLSDCVSPLLWSGFMVFEQVYQVSPPRAGQESVGLDQVVHLRKLAPRLPRTITGFQLGRDGGLESVTQTNPDMFALEDVKIPVRQLVVYTNKKEGADFSGRSVLRTAYRDWLMKDIYIRLDAQAAERNSMGIPVLTITDSSQQGDAERIGAEYRAGANAFVVKPVGVGLELMGVTGSTIDLTAKIKYLDESIAQSALAMFLTLGHDAGARSLGDTFYSGVFLPAVQSIADYIAEVATEHIIRDLVEQNFGPDEPYPVMTAGDLTANQGVEPAVLQSLAAAGLITPDGKLEASLRTRLGLPEQDEATARVPAVPPMPGRAPAAAPQEQAAADDVPFVDGWTDPIVPATLSQDPLDRATALLAQMVEHRKRGHV